MHFRLQICEQLDVEFKSEPRKMAIYGQSAKEITVAEGKP